MKKTYGGFLGAKIAYVKKVNRIKMFACAIVAMFMVANVAFADNVSLADGAIAVGSSLAVMMPIGGAEPGQNGGGGQDIRVMLENPNPSFIDLSGDLPINPMQAPDIVPISLGKTTTSTNAGAAKTGYFLNEDTYNATPTDNGGGAGTIVNTYADGWTGLGYNNLAKSVNGGLGIMVYGLTFVYVTTSTGAQSAAGLSTANPTLLTASFVGGTMRPSPLPLNTGINNDQYQEGTMTIKKKMYLSSANQISYGIPINSTITVVVKTKAF